jgi:hypothetical protein
MCQQLEEALSPKMVSAQKKAVGGSSGTNVKILEIFSPKNWRKKIWRF